MKTLIEYIEKHTSAFAPESEDSVDLVFFHVQPKGGDAETLLGLLKEHLSPLNLADNKEHGYIEIGAALGSQELALRLMGLGTALNTWKLLSPYTVLGQNTTKEQALELAGVGMVTIIKPKFAPD
ncbi:hypothetical protein LC612_29335 [Nostoc sp. CHAB 5834]|nr:hypothetical protein [Nostoc sp. CHAB 5834]